MLCVKSLLNVFEVLDAQANALYPSKAKGGHCIKRSQGCHVPKVFSLRDVYTLCCFMTNPSQFISAGEGLIVMQSCTRISLVIHSIIHKAVVITHMSVAVGVTN